MHTMVEHEGFDGDRHDSMTETVDELLTAGHGSGVSWWIAT